MCCQQKGGMCAPVIVPHWCGDSSSGRMEVMVITDGGGDGGGWVGMEVVWGWDDNGGDGFIALSLALAKSRSCLISQSSSSMPVPTTLQGLTPR